MRKRKGAPSAPKAGSRKDWFDELKAGFDEAFEAAQTGKAPKPLDVSYAVAVRAAGRPRFVKEMRDPASCQHMTSVIGQALICSKCGRMELPE